MAKPPPAETHPMRYILRIDAGHHSWKVSIRRTNRHLHKYFTDSRHGGTVAALAAAMAYRDALVARTSDADYEIWKRERPRPNNTSGITGVAHYVQCAPGTSRRRNYAYWQAFYMDLDGKRQTRSFTEAMYGKRGAREQALRFRREGLERVHREAQNRLQQTGPV
jgi:hypothetical protein